MEMCPLSPFLAVARNRWLAFILGAAVGFAPAGAAEAPGHIRIDAESGLQVFLDGHLRGATTGSKGGLLLENISAGEHRLTVVKRGFAPDEQPLVIRPGFVTVAATFALEPKADAPAPARDSRPKPLAAIEQARAELRVAERAHETAKPPPPAGTQPATEHTEVVRQHTLRLQALRTALTAARQHLTEIEEAVSARFRGEYAALRRLGREPGASAERRQAAWRELSTTWQLADEARPATLVWRNHQPEIARGTLRIRFGPSWPARLGAPVFFIDGARIQVPPASSGDAHEWEMGGLTAAPHTLRIEHPAIEPGSAEFAIRDGMATSLNWTPKFHDRRRP